MLGCLTEFQLSYKLTLKALCSYAKCPDVYLDLLHVISVVHVFNVWVFAPRLLGHGLVIYKRILRTFGPKLWDYVLWLSDDDLFESVVLGLLKLLSICLFCDGLCIVRLACVTSFEFLSFCRVHFLFTETCTNIKEAQKHKKLLQTLKLSLLEKMSQCN